MPVRQTIALNAVASLIALSAYTVAVMIYAVWDSSDFNRLHLQRHGPRFGEFFALYFLYFAWYLGLAVALTIERPFALRIATGTAVAIGVVPAAHVAFQIGLFLGVLLFLISTPLLGLYGLFVALLAVPATGATVGAAITATLAAVARKDFRRGTWAALWRSNALTAAACACLAGWFSNAHAPPSPPGLARLTEDLLVGLSGPLFHTGAAVALAVSRRTKDWRPDREAMRAALGMLAIVFALLAGGIAVAFTTSDRQSRTSTGLKLPLVAKPAISAQ